MDSHEYFASEGLYNTCLHIPNFLRVLELRKLAACDRKANNPLRFKIPNPESYEIKDLVLKEYIEDPIVFKDFLLKNLDNESIISNLVRF